MRKFILALIAISFAAIANAQIYGGGSLALQTNSDAESTQISIVPEIGYVLNDKVIVLRSFTKLFAMAGLRLGYAVFGSIEAAEKTNNDIK